MNKQEALKRFAEMEVNAANAQSIAREARNDLENLEQRFQALIYEMSWKRAEDERQKFTAKFAKGKNGY